MSQITIEIKNGYEIQVAKYFASFQYPSDQVPPVEEHVAAIQAKIEELIFPAYLEAIEKDAEVVAAKQAYEAKVAEKTAAINVAGK